MQLVYTVIITHSSSHVYMFINMVYHKHKVNLCEFRSKLLLQIEKNTGG